MLLIGSHVGFKKDSQLLGSLDEALSYNENTFMFYTGAPQNTSRSVLDDSLIEIAHNKMKDLGIDSSKVIVHAPYIINLCNENNFDFSVSFLTEEVKRVSALGIKYLVLHPGSHVGIGIDAGIDNIVKGLNIVLDNTKSLDVVILLETMAGKGSEVGRNFEEIKAIIDGVELDDKLGVCFDTCHVWDGGYDIADDIDKVLEEFDKVIGLNRLKAVHLNDSMNVCGSHKDRHQKIGLGKIGETALKNVVTHPVLQDKPFILETPNNDEGYKKEIAMIRDWMI